MRPYPAAHCFSLSPRTFNPHPPPLRITIHNIQVLEVAKSDEAKWRT